ncbi:MAG: amidophosphoribosyltransferase [Micavibrio aeruginosavorus]|uniref:Amidophosphoribosyltransferase n=1 Tax=Micavibrio aeruginosavorus TaxID=349221 RepID=A0A2W5C1I4_9BACT|nr:MAG: amidophosphoribosyltransferase [Micavibrio aeruginosavorus]
MCGIVGIVGNQNVAGQLYDGLTVLQHRGQDAAGIATANGSRLRVQKATGLVRDVFDARTMSTLEGSVGIAHVRYPTAGSEGMDEAQPFYVNSPYGIALAHNGNLINTEALRQQVFEQDRRNVNTDSDSEVLLNVFAYELEQQRQLSPEAAIRAVAGVHRRCKGGYAVVSVVLGLGLVAFRDPHGIRPLVLGKLGGSYILASESCALDIIGADYVRDIDAGEMVIVDKSGIRSMQPFKKTEKRLCIFEYVYFARPDSVMEGHSVYEMRKNIGAILAREAPVANADVVVPVPDSGVPSAIGYSQASGVPFELGIIRNHYVGRTFIEPTAQIRHLGVKLKHNANRQYLKDKVVVLVDDSIVRGTTSRKIVEMVRQAGAKEVHMRISSPPTAHSCFYGIDTPSTEDLMAHTHTVQQIADHIGVDSLSYISVDGLYQAMGEAKRNNASPQYCDACFTGEYPVELVDKIAGCSTPKVKAKLGAKMLVSVDD